MCCIVVQGFSSLRMGLFFLGGAAAWFGLGDMAELLLLFSIISPNFGWSGSHFWGGLMLFFRGAKKMGCRKTHEVQTCLWLRCEVLWKDNECKENKKKKRGIRSGEKQERKVKGSMDRGCRIFGCLPKHKQVCLPLCVAWAFLCVVHNIAAFPLTLVPSIPSQPSLSTPSHYACFPAKRNDIHASQLRLPSLSPSCAPLIVLYLHAAEPDTTATIIIMITIIIWRSKPSGKNKTLPICVYKLLCVDIQK